MKQQIKAISRRLSRLPVIGRLVHIAAAVYHLPRLRAQLENGLPRMDALDGAWHHRFSALQDANARNAQRVVAVEQSAIGLLTGIMGQLGALKGNFDVLADTSTASHAASISRIDAIEHSSSERLTQLAAEIEVVRVDVASALHELRQQIEGNRLLADQQVADVLLQLAPLKNGIEANNETTRAATQQAATAVARVDELALNIGNIVRSLPIVLRELRREQTRLHSMLSGATAEMKSVSEPTPYGEALNALLENGERHVMQATDALRTELEVLSQRVETLVGTHGVTVSSVQELTDTLQFLVGRIEFVRREILFEMRYGKEVRDVPDQKLKVDSQIVAIDKVTKARDEGMRLNLGCGHVPLAGYVNVDRRALPGVDVVAEVEDLPFEAGEVIEIMSSHVLEHFPQEQLVRELLPYWQKLLREGGEFRAIVPDADAMIEHYASGDYAYDDMREVIYGAQDYRGDFHYNMFTPQSLSKMLMDAGFVQIRVDQQGRKIGKCYEFEIRATKGS